MKLKFKKYLYLVNDVTNLLLNKDREHLIEDVKKLKIALIIASVVFVMSLGLNVYLIINN